MVDDGLEKRLLAGAAFRMFHAEAERYAGQIAILDSENPPGAETTKIWCAAFHTLKGSSGFFGLREFAALAGELEKRFSLSIDPSAWSETRQLVRNFREALHALPTPQAP
jgi:chemotaxis protein histidine kinase CheA